MWFSAAEPVHGDEPRRTDGTTLELAGEIAPGAADSSPGTFAVSGGRLYIEADDGLHGNEPWVSDGGTPALLADVRPGPDGSNPRLFTALGADSYFFAYDGVHGLEPWWTDGTSARLAGDVLPGADGSFGAIPFVDPGTFVRAGDALYFAADDGAHGAELWALAPAVPPPPPGGGGDGGAGGAARPRAAADRGVRVTLTGRRLALSRRGVAKLRIACPASETAGPCRGTVALKTRGKVRHRGRRRVVTLASARFAVAAGSSRLVALRLGRSQRALVRGSAAARRVGAVVKVRDGAGNRATVTRALTLTLPSGGRRG